MITTPFVSADAFKAHPTYLDLDDLRSGSASDADQTAELYNLLLMASDWASNRCNQPLNAHSVVQNCRARFDRYGNLKIHPDHTPVLRIGSVGYGWTPTALTVVNSSTAWVEDGRNIVFSLGDGANMSWSGSLQFGTPVSGGEVFVQVTYDAAWVATTLASATDANATSLPVTDPTGVMPGASYRIWEPGAEETVTVSPDWTPPAVGTMPATTTVTLSAPTRNAHTAGQDFSGMPADMRLAVTNYAVSALMRPDTAAEDAYPDTRLNSGTRSQDPRKDGSGLVAEAERILARYARIR